MYLILSGSVPCSFQIRSLSFQMRIASAMNKQELWQRYQDYLCVHPSVGLVLDISHMKFPHQYLEEMTSPMQNAFAKMNALENGCIANPHENRMVGHYWLRHPALAPSRRIQTAIEKNISEIKNFAGKIHAGILHSPTGKSFQKILLVGIGGSALGPQFIHQALGVSENRMAFYCLDNTDPDGMDLLFGEIGPDLSETLVLVISKSGRTIETRNGMLEVEAAYRRVGLQFAGHAVAITGSGSALEEKALTEGWLDVFPIWDWVGGRTSLFSSVGLLPACLEGIEIDGLLTGAANMDQITRQADVRQNPSALLALMWYYAGEGKGNKNMVILPYKDRLAFLSRYLQQLIMESLGKEKNLSGEVVHQGITVYGNKGSTDQHAFVQQLREGAPDFFVTFVQVLQERIPLPSSDGEKRIPLPSNDEENSISLPSKDGKSIPLPWREGSGEGEKGGSPLKSQDQERIPPSSSDGEKRIPPSSSDGEKRIPLSSSDSEKRIPSSSCDGEKRTPPSSSYEEKRIPPSSSDGEKRIPLPWREGSGEGEKGGSPLKSQDQERIPLPSCDGEKRIPSSSSDGEKRIPPSSNDGEKRIPLPWREGPGVRCRGEGEKACFPLKSLEVESSVTTGDFLQGFLLGTEEALYDNDRESMTITLDAVNASTIGALLALFERAVGFYASLVQINAYHQPGVEAGKKAASTVLDLQSKILQYLKSHSGRYFTLEEITAAIDHPDDCRTSFKILEYLTRNERGISKIPGTTYFEGTYGYEM